jgi:hypothetical protein
LEGAGFVVVDVEDFEDVREFQARSHARWDVGQLQLDAVIAHRLRNPAQFAETCVGAVANNLT